MENVDICTNFLHIIAGTSNTIASAYVEASSNMNNNDKVLKYLNNFITSIENVASKNGAVDKRISATKGSMKDFVGYDNIETSLKFLSTHKTPTGNAIVNDLKQIHTYLDKYESYYTEGYRKNIRLIMLEYESAMYLLVTGLAMSLSYNFDVTESNGQIKMTPKPKAYFGVTGKKIHEMAEELGKKIHEEYLDEIIKVANSNTPISEGVDDSVYLELSLDTVTGTLSLIGAVWNNLKKVASVGLRGISSIKKSIFGIIPLIRSVIYLSYKRKADTIMALDQSVAFIEQNIERLNSRTNIDPAKKEQIIKKQKAQVEAYKKKAEKLRAELEEGEKDAVTAAKKEEPQLGNTDDDFVLESVEEDDEYIDMFESGFNKNDIMKKRKNAFFKSLNKTVKIVASSQSKNIDLNSEDMESLLKKVIDEFIKNSSKPTIRLKLEKVSDDSNVTRSKIGGQPYWPTDKKYPTYNGKDMVMLAQLNFSELPNIPNYPKSGILQFFVVNGDLEYDDCNKLKAIYHEKINKDIDKSSRPKLSDAKYPIAENVYNLTGSVENAYPCDMWSPECTDNFLPIFNKYFGTDYSSFKDLYGLFGNKLMEDLYNKIENMGSSWGTRIGGYPSFVQYDPRTGNKRVYNTLLFQIDSESGIMIGDCGIANIFINESKLKSKDFDDVFFTWDCC